MTTESGAVNSGKLTDFTIKVLQKLGVPEEDAHITASILVATDLRGVDSHGVARLVNYVKWIKEGAINVKPEIRVFSQAPATAIMDGDMGLGFVVGHRAMLEAMRRAETTGIGLVTVRNSTHFGSAANYAIMALSHNMIGISMTFGGKGMEVPGSRGRRAGINVISIAAPAQEESPFVLDMATTVVAGGKVEIALRKDMIMPEGWVVNMQGKPITDPKKYYEEECALLPLGGIPILGSYKGFGLSVAVEILCNILSGSTIGPKDPPVQVAGRHFFGAIRIDGFISVTEFKRAMDNMMRSYHDLPKAEDVDRICLAGEFEEEIRKERLSKGIPLHPHVVASLQKLAGEMDIEYNL